MICNLKLIRHSLSLRFQILEPRFKSIQPISAEEASRTEILKLRDEQFWNQEQMLSFLSQQQQQTSQQSAQQSVHQLSSKEDELLEEFLNITNHDSYSTPNTLSLTSIQ